MGFSGRSVSPVADRELEMRGPATTASGYGSPSVEAVARFAPGPEQDLSNDLPPAKVDNHGVGMDLADASSPGPHPSGAVHGPEPPYSTPPVTAQMQKVDNHGPGPPRSMVVVALRPRPPLVPHHSRSGRACRAQSSLRLSHLLLALELRRRRRTWLAERLFSVPVGGFSITQRQGSPMRQHHDPTNTVRAASWNVAQRIQNIDALPRDLQLIALQEVLWRSVEVGVTQLQRAFPGWVILRTVHRFALRCLSGTALDGDSSQRACTG